MEPYQALANAIVELAVKDYKKALKQHFRFPNNKDYANEVASLERRNVRPRQKGDAAVQVAAAA